MTRWVGRWIIMVGVVHCVFGAINFYEPLSGIVRDGLWNAVDGYPGRPLAFWSWLAFGFWQSPRGYDGRDRRSNIIVWDNGYAL